MDGGEKVVPLGDEHPFVEVRAGREDLRDLALDELAGPGVLHLIADGDLASGLEHAGDVTVRRVKRNAAHRDDAALGERDVEQLRAGLRVLEKHLVEIAEPEQQQRVLGQFAFDAAILRHHGRELGVAAHHANVSAEKIFGRKKISAATAGIFLEIKTGQPVTFSLQEQGRRPNTEPVSGKIIFFGNNSQPQTRTEVNIVAAKKKATKKAGKKKK